MSDESRFQLRRATEADRTYLCRLNFLTEVYGDESQPLPEEATDWFEYYVAAWSAEHGGVIAWDGINPAGGVWLNWGHTDSAAGNPIPQVPGQRTHGFGHVEEGIPELALAVEERYKGQGVGTALIEAATELAREMGAPGISLSVAQDNPRAERLYRHLGFREVGEREGHFILVRRFQ